MLDHDVFVMLLKYGDDTLFMIRWINWIFWQCRICCIVCCIQLCILHFVEFEPGLWNLLECIMYAMFVVSTIQVTWWIGLILVWLDCMLCICICVSVTLLVLLCFTWFFEFLLACVGYHGGLKMMQRWWHNETMSWWWVMWSQDSDDIGFSKYCKSGASCKFGH